MPVRIRRVFTEIVRVCAVVCEHIPGQSKVSYLDDIILTNQAVARSLQTSDENSLKKAKGKSYQVAMDVTFGLKIHHC